LEQPQAVHPLPKGEYFPFFFKKNQGNTDILNVGPIVPLPNHYISDMPQGQGRLITYEWLSGLFFRVEFADTGYMKKLFVLMAAAF
jgi:hypothetical protein